MHRLPTLTLTVVLFAALVAALIAGLLPAFRAAAPGQAAALKGSRSSAGRGERRLLAAIATVQVICTVALLAGAALLIRTASRLASALTSLASCRVNAASVSMRVGTI